MDPVSSKDIPVVCIDFMNQTHLEEVEIVSSLIHEINSRQSNMQNDTQISQQLSHWYEHTLMHFTRENELMQETAFPAFLVHSKEHETALSTMRSEIDIWQEQKNVERLENYLSVQWPNWFKGHVSTMDKVTAEYAVKSGYTIKY